jgi:CubicO group peptidase (beta-lactamase class C family)
MPPERGPQGPVTARNWQDPPYNRWAYWHAAEILPAYRVARGTGPARALPELAAPEPAAPKPAAPGLLETAVTRLDGSADTVADVLAGTFTDAYLVLQDGQLVTEWYHPQGAADRNHALMSVSKSLVGCVAAVLIDRGQLDPDGEITSYVPELAVSGYAAARVRHVLDMRSGISFTEEYDNPRADIRRLDEWIGWPPSETPSETPSQPAGEPPGEPAGEPGSGPGGEPRGLYRFLATLSAEVPHGARFLYRSAESDVLGWVCERASGQPMAGLLSELVWAPMGAEHDADLLHDGLGTAVHDGGLCATARDVARFGQLLLDGGVVRDQAGGTRRVVPPLWLRQAWAVDADARAVFAASPAESAFPGGWYRNQFWFRPGDYGDVLLCLGIHGQMVHVSRRTRTVCVKFSSWPQAQNPFYLEDTLRAFDALGGALSGRQPAPGRAPLAGTAGTAGVPGLVAGLNRHGATHPSAAHPSATHLSR